MNIRLPRYRIQVCKNTRVCASEDSHPEGGAVFYSRVIVSLGKSEWVYLNRKTVQKNISRYVHSL